MELFKRYNYIISTTFLIVFAISIILFYLQFNSRYEHEVIQVKNQIQERLLNLDYMIKVATNQIDAMQIAAQSSCLTFDKKYYIPSALFSQLADGEDYYHLDNFKPPYNKNLIGNLTGTGSFQNRSADYYREIGMAFKLNSYFQATVHNIPNIAWVYYTSANGFANLYPWVASKDFKFTEEFYNHEFYQLGLPEHNPEHKRYWTSAYIDEAGKGLMVSCAAPVYRGDIFRGTVALDFTLDVLNTFVKGFKEQHTTLFISNQNNQLLAHPTLVSSKDKTVKPVAVAFPETIREQSAQLLQTQNGEIQETDSHLFFHQNLENAPWQLIALIPKQEIIINAIYETSWGFLVLLPGLALILIMTSFLTRKEFIKPARMLVKHIENEGINAPVILPVGWQTWFESVTKTFHENRNLVTELQASLTSLERKNIELQQLDKTKDEFLANTSHELRTPLYGIIGIAESLTDGATGKLNQFTNNSLNMIVNSGKRLSTLVNDILDFSKLKHKELELQLKPVSLRAMAEVVIFLNKPSLGNLQIINSIPKDLPAVYADENRLQQILYNLIGNAIKFTDFGTIEISAKIIANEQLEITIADTGVGIDEENLAKIFQSFEQADGSTAREYGGTGLGLAITKQLIELHNGKIWVKSKLEVGSQFIFTLPITKSLSKMSPSSTAKYAKELLIEPVDIIMPTQTEGLFTILIVDDEPVNIQILINFLSSLNYNIIRANSGKEACTLFEQGIKPDIVLLDVMMPGMTGYETAKKIRQHFPINELPILMLTAKNQISDLVTGLRAGANDYLTKPVAKNELLARVKMHLHLHNLNAAYSRFVPHEFLKFLNKESIVDIRLGDHVEQEMTVLFADIRDFTSLSESMTPQQNFNLINSYLRRMEPVIRQHHGFIDKYIGDSIMALFPKADEAVQAGINMLHILREYNVTRGQPQRPKLNIGVGIHTGKLMLGTIGGEHRMDSTVIADAV
ncbi:MAG: response regulator, partial [Candidatus Marithrix sp.]|nr:response regulator [Candidatus Marithrix sp.]